MTKGLKDIVTISDVNILRANTGLLEKKSIQNASKIIWAKWRRLCVKLPCSFSKHFIVNGEPHIICCTYMYTCTCEVGNYGDKYIDIQYVKFTLTKYIIQYKYNYLKFTGAQQRKGIESPLSPISAKVCIVTSILAMHKRYPHLKLVNPPA